MQPMQIDPNQVGSAANDIAASAQDLGTALTQLQTTVTTKNPWGSDEPGSLFGMAYVEVLGHALQVLGSHADLMMGAATGLADMANSVAQTDQAGAAHMNSISSGMRAV
jgi:hypothetical protein